ncbi:hypothetical protein FKM82_000680 [Ascaphus truei]
MFVHFLYLSVSTPFITQSPTSLLHPLYLYLSFTLSLLLPTYLLHLCLPSIHLLYPSVTFHPISPPSFLASSPLRHLSPSSATSPYFLIHHSPSCCT